MLRIASVHYVSTLSHQQALSATAVASPKPNALILTKLNDKAHIFSVVIFSVQMG